LFITVHGAANEVTGSCYLVETGNARLLVDCGLFQGFKSLEKLNRIPKTLTAKKIDAVVLTHGHLDHCGRLPLLVKQRYKGPIYATEGTIDIAKLILNDAAKIQVDDAKRENRKRGLSGNKEIPPLFAPEDVAKVCDLFRPIAYNHWIDIAEGIKIQFVEAGHILGSSSVEMVVNQNGGRRHLVFSGDLGSWDMPIMRDPAKIKEADVVFLESTYGNRDHRPLAATVLEFEELLKKAIKDKGKVLIPSFAVGRTQQILYHLAELFRTKVIPPIPIYLDSPMATAATELYAKHQELMDEEAQTLHRSGQLRKDLATLKICTSPEESQALNELEGPFVIIAGAGMCNAGRILHHFRHNLPSPETLVLIVGYQSKGSLGRRLIEGASEVKIFGQTVKVRATVRGLGGFSAHAGQTDLLRWVAPMAVQKPRIMLTHGESPQIQGLAQKIKERFEIDCEVPKLFETIPI
jgi:metallo-beta-lactamase family protein